MDIYLLFGPPGSGKGSLGKLLPKGSHLSIGSLLREQNIDCSNGKLVSDEYVNSLVLKYLKQNSQKEFLVLDGYPRTESQAIFLKKYFQDRIKTFIHLSCSDEEVIDRVCFRETCNCGCSYHPRLKPSKKVGICDACGSLLKKRSDDTKEIIQERLLVYKKEKNKILRHFQDKYVDVSVERDFKESLKKIAQFILSGNENYIKDIRNFPIGRDQIKQFGRE